MRQAGRATVSPDLSINLARSASVRPSVALLGLASCHADVLQVGRESARAWTASSSSLSLSADVGHVAHDASITYHEDSSRTKRRSVAPVRGSSAASRRLASSRSFELRIEQGTGEHTEPSGHLAKMYPRAHPLPPRPSHSHRFSLSETKARSRCGRSVGRSAVPGRNL